MMGETCELCNALTMGKCTLKNNSDEVRPPGDPLATLWRLVPPGGPSGPLSSLARPPADSFSFEPSVLEGSLT